MTLMRMYGYFAVFQEIKTSTTVSEVLLLAMLCVCHSYFWLKWTYVFFLAFLFGTLCKTLICSSLQPITLRWVGPSDARAAMSDANVQESLLYHYCTQYVAHSLPVWLHIMLLSLLLYSSHSPVPVRLSLEPWELIFLLFLCLSKVALPPQQSS